mmetsp:Transcript_29042/g.68438  ORF Transcript_29042/g.68438 Transcript_29042/m.68438 type:complete len:217 (+) Transcript_29042:143-793(+)
MTVSYCDDATPGNEKLGSLATSSVHGTVYCVVIPQDRVDLVDVLAVLEVFVNALDVAREASTPPRVVGTHTPQVISDLYLFIRPTELLLPSVVDGSEPTSGNRSIHVHSLKLNQPLHQVKPAKLTSYHQRRLELLIQWRILVRTLEDEVVHLLDAALDACLLEAELELRQAVPEEVVGETLRKRPFIQGWIVRLWFRQGVEELCPNTRAGHALSRG